MTGKKQWSAIASIYDNLELPLNKLLDISPLKDSLKSDQDSTTLDSSLPMGGSLDFEKSALDMFAEFNHLLSDMLC